MVTTRTPIGRATHVRVTPHMIELWRQLTRSRLTHEARIDAELELYRLAQREPWQKALMDIDPNAEDPSVADLQCAKGIDGWYAGRDLVRALEAAAQTVSPGAPPS